jgi:hypothetical protein
MTDTVSHSSLDENTAIVGRADLHDVEAILSVVGSDEGETIRAVKDNADALFTWNYEKGERPALNRLYEKAKTSQWNGETDLDWSIEVDQEAVVSGSRSASSRRTGCSASSCTASRARCCAPRRSSRPCRGSTPSTTPPPR